MVSWCWTVKKEKKIWMVRALPQICYANEMYTHQSIIACEENYQCISLKNPCYTFYYPPETCNCHLIHSYNISCKASLNRQALFVWNCRRKIRSKYYYRSLFFSSPLGQYIWPSSGCLTVHGVFMHHVQSS